MSASAKVNETQTSTTDRRVQAGDDAKLYQDVGLVAGDGSQIIDMSGGGDLVFQSLDGDLASKGYEALVATAAMFGKGAYDISDRLIGVNERLAQTVDQSSKDTLTTLRDTLSGTMNNQNLAGVAESSGFSISSKQGMTTVAVVGALLLAAITLSRKGDR